MLARLDSDRNRSLFLFAALTAFAVALNLSQLSARRSGRTLWFESAACALSAVPQQALIGAMRIAEREWRAAVGARTLISENERLQAQVAGLERRLSETSEARSASDRTRRLSAARPTKATARTARVIGLGEDGWSQVMTVDCGHDDGVRQGDVAVGSQGVIGQVAAVTAGTARVLVLTAPGSSIAVRLQRSREAGILKGAGGSRCEIRYLDPQADVRVGDAVITSGLGGIFPAGLRVGTVTGVGEDRETPGKAARVRPYSELRRTEEVLLLRAR